MLVSRFVLSWRRRSSKYFRRRVSLQFVDSSSIKSPRHLRLDCGRTKRKTGTRLTIARLGLRARCKPNKNLHNLCLILGYNINPFSFLSYCWPNSWGPTMVTWRKFPGLGSWMEVEVYQWFLGVVRRFTTYLVHSSTLQTQVFLEYCIRLSSHLSSVSCTSSYTPHDFFFTSLSTSTSFVFQWCRSDFSTPTFSGTSVCKLLFMWWTKVCVFRRNRNDD